MHAFRVAEETPDPLEGQARPDGDNLIKHERASGS